jgi:hypothetical protein
MRFVTGNRSGREPSPHREPGRENPATSRARRGMTGFVHAVQAWAWSSHVTGGRTTAMPRRAVSLNNITYPR